MSVDKFLFFIAEVLYLPIFICKKMFFALNYLMEQWCKIVEIVLAMSFNNDVSGSLESGTYREIAVPIAIILWMIAISFVTGIFMFCVITSIAAITSVIF